MSRDRRVVGTSAAPSVLIVGAAAVAGLAMLVSRIVPEHAGLWWNIAWTASAGAALGGMLLARRTATGLERARWSLWAAAAGCWVVGQLMWNLYGLIGFPAPPTPDDIARWRFASLM